MMYKISHSDNLLIKTQSLGLRLVTDFFPHFFHNFSRFLIILFFYKLYIAIINHKQDLCLSRKNDSLMILQYSYILVISHIKEKKCKKEKQRNDGHLQHIMASLVIIYNLCSDFLFLFDVGLIFHQRSQQLTSESISDSQS